MTRSGMENHVVADEPMHGNEQAFDDRYVLFLDFLGAADAAKTWPRERLHEFVDLLGGIANIQRPQKIAGAARQDGSYGLSVAPEITTFSDNIVMSYPSASTEKQAFRLASATFEPFWTEIVLHDAIRIVEGIAARATNRAARSRRAFIWPIVSWRGCSLRRSYGGRLRT